MAVTSRRTNELVPLPVSRRVTRSDHVIATIRLAACASVPRSQVLWRITANVACVFKGVAYCLAYVKVSLLRNARAEISTRENLQCNFVYITPVYSVTCDINFNGEYLDNFFKKFPSRRFSTFKHSAYNIIAEWSFNKIFMKVTLAHTRISCNNRDSWDMQSMILVSLI